VSRPSQPNRSRVLQNETTFRVSSTPSIPPLHRRFFSTTHLQVGHLLNLGVRREVEVLLGVDDTLWARAEDDRMRGRRVTGGDRGSDGSVSVTLLFPGLCRVFYVSFVCFIFS
jgi:hypothetical protein